MSISRIAYERAWLENFPVKPLTEGLLAKLGRDLTVLAHANKLGPVWGREVEMQQMIEVLGRRTKPNPIILGEAGVGKTTLVEKLAQEIIQHAANLPYWVRGCKIVEISYVAIAGQSSQNWSEYLQNVRRAFEEATNKPIILFIDEIHQLWAFPISFAHVKPLIARGDVRIIGATTLAEYHKYLESDSALDRRFFPIHLEEPKLSEIPEMLKTLLPVYKRHYHVSCDPDVLPALVQLAEIYLPNYRQPGISIEILESAFVRQRVLRPEVGIDTNVDLDVVRGLIAERAKIPIGQIEPIQKRFRAMSQNLSSRIVGQQKIVQRVLDRILLCKARLDVNPARPDGVFLFAGAPGVGKTEFAKVLAEELTGKKNGLLFMDMASYASADSYQFLVRSHQAHSDAVYGESPFLERIRDMAHGVLLLDEIEKAHPIIWNFFLKIFDEGQVEDKLGIVTVFSSMTIIMTSNIGFSTTAMGRAILGFSADKELVKDKLLREKVLAAIESYFPYEFLNRIDEMFVFNRLTREDCKKILQLNLRKYELILKKNLCLTSSALELLLARGFSEKWGARRLIRTIENRLGKELIKLQQQLPDKAAWDRIRKIHIGCRNQRLRILKTE